MSARPRDARDRCSPRCSRAAQHRPSRRSVERQPPAKANPRRGHAMSVSQRTQVAIIGAGPAGLLLGHLLHRHGVDSVILEARTREYCEARIRAGVLEQGTRDLLLEAGLGDRMTREGLVPRGIYLTFDDRRQHIAMDEL